MKRSGGRDLDADLERLVRKHFKIGWVALLVFVSLGLFLGGIVTHGGDPGIGVFLAPVGAIVLWIGVAIFVRDALRAKR